MNYSMHDESHSINILESIEMFLGKDRINKLSRSDLWLILNVAYAHDIGMVSEYKNLKELWSNNEFQKYIENAKNSLDKDEAKAVNLYTILDNLLKVYSGESTFEVNDRNEFEYYDAWPLEVRKDITMLMANFIRKKHGKLSEDFFKTPENLNNYIVCDRLFRLIGRISVCHTENQESLENLPKCCKGFGSDRMHPRFVATLLRLGDLLNLDNNRFDIFSMKHFGPLPEISVLNYKKHKSITHFHIEPKVIEVTAQSDEFEVCKLNHAWFQYLEKDIIYLITHWSQMAPKGLKGCLLGVPKLEVIHGKYKFYDNSNSGFVLEKKKILKLFTGNNLYSSKLDFVREYIQNAFDASKLQLYYEIKDFGKKSHNDIFSKSNLYIKDQDISLDDIKPFNLTETAFESFPIVIALTLDKEDRESFILRISDRGIGIDREGLEAISNVGTGWKKREKHTKAILKMRKWLRPTGGFGIGLQSAFLCTDSVCIYTKAPFEEAYKIVLSDSSNEKNVLVEVDIDNIHRGTTAEFKIKFSAFDKKKIISNYLETGGKDAIDVTNKDLFSPQDKLKIIKAILKKYIQINFPTSLFPIKILVDEGNEYGGIETETIISSFVYNNRENSNKFEVPHYTSYLNSELGTKENDFFKFSQELIGNSKKLWVNIEKACMRVWDDEKQIFYYFANPKKDMEEINIWANYKNVLVKDNTKKVKVKNTTESEFIEAAYDVMGVSVENCLVVSRNRFKKRQTIILDELMKVYARILLNDMMLPIDFLMNAILATQLEVSLDELTKKYKGSLDTEMLDILEVSDENEKGKIEINKRVISIKSFLDKENTYIWMVQINNQEKLEKKKIYQYVALNNEEKTIQLRDEDNKLFEISKIEWENIKILCDEKFNIGDRHD